MTASLFAKYSRRRRPPAPLVLLAACLPALAAAQEPIAVPSGQPLTLHEVLLDEAPGELWARFRFLAPELTRDGAGGVGPQAALDDMAHLCDTLALPYLAAHGIDARRVVISLADRPVPFGTTDPQATQFFETYRPENGRCIWEGY